MFTLQLVLIKPADSYYVHVVCRKACIFSVSQSSILIHDVDFCIETILYISLHDEMVS